MSAQKYWLWIATRPKLTQRQMLQILDYFGTPERAYLADREEYRLLPDPSPAVIEACSDKSLEEAEDILERCAQNGIRILTISDAEYPYRLRNIDMPPIVLYVKGTLPAFDDEVAITVVGAREATAYGVRVAERFAGELTRCGALVVSGSARGIDTAALSGALKNGGSPVSVLGNGIDVIYPAGNRALYDAVAASGALISEFPPGTEPLPQNFPIRNRILSGLALGVLVVEGTKRSGSLITARLALDQGRDVFAIPGNIYAPMSHGPDLLIQRSEAKLVTRSWDILEEYISRFPHKLQPLNERPAEEQKTQPTAAQGAETVPPEPASTTEENVRYLDWPPGGGQSKEDRRAILLALEEGPMQAEEIMEATGLEVQRILSALTLLQLDGHVAEDAGKRFTAAVRIKK